jgi:DNA-binding GntR family transcriptional regulator
MARSSKDTLTMGAYDQIRAELLRGTLRPGAPLRMQALSERLGVSGAVVREALTRLSEQGLVVASPQRGFRVMELSVEHLQDLTNVRAQLESLALAQSIEHGTIAWEADVVAALHTLLATPVKAADDSGLNDAWPIAHRRFHAALLTASGSPVLESIVNHLRDQAELYRVWSWSLADPSKPRDLDAEHRAIAEAAVARDSELATSRLAAHLRATAQAVTLAAADGT